MESRRCNIYDFVSAYCSVSFFLTRSVVSRSPDERNRFNMRTVNGVTTTCSFDANGNTLYDGARSCIWDAQNRMIKCITGANDYSTFTYGPDGLRRTMTITQGGVTKPTTYFLYEGQSVACDQQDSDSDGVGDTNLAIYMAGPRGIEYRKALVDPGNPSSGYVVKWYIYDGLGSVMGEVEDQTGLFNADISDSSSKTYHIYITGITNL